MPIGIDTTRRSTLDGLGYLKDPTAPVPIQDVKPTCRLIEADVISTDTSQCGKGQSTLFNHPVAHLLDDVDGGARNRTGDASM